MSKHKIEWTDKTWNPIVGCSKLRTGCKNCYAERMAHRLKGMISRNSFDKAKLTKYAAATNNEGRWTGQVGLVESELTRPKSWRKGRRIFVCSMSDLFHEELAAAARDRVFAAMLSAPQHTYQIVTKRYKEAAEYTEQLMEVYKAAGHCGRNAIKDNANIHWLFSASDQSEVNEACENLMYLQVATSGLCLEPLLGPVVLPEHIPLDWIIVGGESGPGARPMHPGWVRDLRDQCRQRKIPFFFKQWGAWLPNSQSRCVSLEEKYKARRKQISYDMYGPSDVYRVGKKKAGRILDGRTWDEYPENNVNQ